MFNTAQRSDVSQIIYSTYSETWIRNLQDDAPFMVEKGGPTETISTKSTASMQLNYSDKSYASFNTGRRIDSK